MLLEHLSNSSWGFVIGYICLNMTSQNSQKENKIVYEFSNPQIAFKKLLWRFDPNPKECILLLPNL